MKHFVGFLIMFWGFIWKAQCYLLITDHSLSRMIEFTPKNPFCITHTNRDFMQEILRKSKQQNVKIIPDEELNKVEEVCKRREVRIANQGGFIYPGTKWCGPGSIAKNFSDLGDHKREDMCCRQHDICPQTLSKGECRDGICNNTPFTRSHCECDTVFKRCLQSLHSETANAIGAIFFNIAQVVCFTEKTCLDSERLNNLQSDSQNQNNSCGLQFVVNERYFPSVAVHYLSGGEKVGSYFNKFLKKIRIF